jgi:hypothetical protein
VEEITQKGESGEEGGRAEAKLVFRSARSHGPGVLNPQKTCPRPGADGSCL